MDVQIRDSTATGAIIMLAYHFVGNKLRDGREVPPDGEWLVHDGELKLCASGLHASKDAFDALQYAPGNMLCLIECGGDIIEGDDKLVCSKRRIIKRLDATALLRQFAREQALSVAHLWEMPEVVRQYLETGDESLRAAAENAARDALGARGVWAAARAAADAALLAVAENAAYDAARKAAWYATGAAGIAWDAALAAGIAWDAARDALGARGVYAAARKRFNELVEAEFNKLLGV